MKKYLIVLLIAAIFLAGCTPSAPPEEINRTPDDIEMDGQTDEEFIDSDEWDESPEPFILLTESESGNVYQGTINDITFCITLEPNMLFQHTIICDDVMIDYYGTMMNRKVGEVQNCTIMEDPSDAAEFFSNIDYDAPQWWGIEEIIVKSDSYTNANGTTITYKILKHGLDDSADRIWSYTYLVPLPDDAYVLFCLWSRSYDRGVDEPRYRKIADSITP